MTAALRVVEPLSLARPTSRPSMRPTLVPTSAPTARPHSGTELRATEPPAPQRSAIVHTRFAAAACHEAQSLLAIMRLNAELLAALLSVDASAVALDALEDLQCSIGRLEHRFAPTAPGHRVTSLAGNVRALENAVERPQASSTDHRA